MKSIKITILGKQYPLKVEDSEVEAMKRISRYVDEKFRQYKKELHKQPETTVMVLAALSIAEELFEERRRNRELSQQDDKILQEVNQSIEKLLQDVSSS